MTLSTLGLAADKSMETSAARATTSTPINEYDMDEYSSRASDAGETGGIGKKNTKFELERKREIWDCQVGQ